MKYNKTIHMIYSKHNLFRHDYFVIRKYNSDCSNHDTTLHCKLKDKTLYYQAEFHGQNVFYYFINSW